MVSMPKTTLFMERASSHASRSTEFSHPRRSRKAVHSEKKAYQGFVSVRNQSSLSSGRRWLFLP